MDAGTPDIVRRAVPILRPMSQPSQQRRAKMLIVDGHAHIYSDDEHVYPRIGRPLRPRAGTGAGTVAHLDRERKTSGVSRVLVIQATTCYGWDNRLLVDTARANPDWMAGICTLDPDNAHGPALLEEYARGHNIRGLRSYQAANGRLDHPGVSALWDSARRLGLIVNVRVNRDKTAQLVALLRRFPDLMVVLDHCLYLAAGPEYEPIVNDVLALARHPNLHAKLTFLPTGSKGPYPFEDMHDACRRIIRAYGPDRCLWGSTFPCELWCPKTSYDRHVRLFTHELGLDARAQESILGKTAWRLYFERAPAEPAPTKGIR
jgi:predicted TIM-barrel fold metal-dependent hydrolase